MHIEEVNLEIKDFSKMAFFWGFFVILPVPKNSMEIFFRSNKIFCSPSYGGTPDHLIAELRPLEAAL